MQFPPTSYLPRLWSHWPHPSVYLVTWIAPAPPFTVSPSVKLHCEVCLAQVHSSINIFRPRRGAWPLVPVHHFPWARAPQVVMIGIADPHMVAGASCPDVLKEWRSRYCQVAHEGDIEGNSLNKWAGTWATGTKFIGSVPEPGLAHYYF